MGSGIFAFSSTFHHIHKIQSPGLAISVSIELYKEKRKVLGTWNMFHVPCWKSITQVTRTRAGDSPLSIILGES